VNNSVTSPTESHPSRAAVKAALDEYRRLSEQGEQGESASVHRALAERLCAAFSAPERPSPTDFNALVQFGLMMGGLEPDEGAPPCNLGDVLTALALNGPEAGWTWDPVVDGHVVTKLQVRETSIGIAKNQRANREGWWAHSTRNRAFIREAVERCSRRGVAVVLGAGQPFDLPLRELARAFDRLVLVDIDGVALEETAASVFADPALRRRVELRTADVTGINRQLLARVEPLVADASHVDEACERVGASVRSYHLPDGPQLLAPGERADLLVSGCMVSQIAWSQRGYARNVVRRRFGGTRDEAVPAWGLGWQELALRLQQDHINALPAWGDVAVLTSDVVVRTTTVDAAGRLRKAEPGRHPLSAPTLRERVPCFLRAEAHAAWEWNLLAPSREPGTTCDVEGLVLRLP
jgi:hypothetical protein